MPTITRALTKTGDWTFGQSLANYLSRADMVRQNVVTRVKSFKNDWFLDVEANIDWLNILANKNNREVIRSEVERVVFSTEGVKSITRLEILEATARRATILIEFETIYDKNFNEQIGVTV